MLSQSPTTKDAQTSFLIDLNKMNRAYGILMTAHTKKRLQSKKQIDSMSSKNHASQAFFFWIVPVEADTAANVSVA